jgi:hypothetical protein
MADAIPVHSTPKKSPHVKPVNASPELDESTGKVVDGNYVAAVRENLGAAGDFASGNEPTPEGADPRGTPIFHPADPTRIVAYRKDN